MSPISLRAAAALALTGLLLAVAAVISPAPLRAQDPGAAPTVADATAGPGGPQYPLGGHVVWRDRADGRTEFCFEPDGQPRVCPDLRVTRVDRLRPDRWTRSSEITWSVPVDPERIAFPPAASAQTGSCDADLNRMFAATWKVETTSWRGSAFHIGGGRFVTAHHVIDGVPPVLALTYGDRSVAAVVLGSDAEHDVALLEVFDTLAVLDVPSVAFRDPTPGDVGEPVYLVGYPSAGA
ncbi:MAG: serine protease [Chloroflexi bacterium]|nr:serine protease [Chloroflexota bacterium]